MSETNGGAGAGAGAGAGGNGAEVPKGPHGSGALRICPVLTMANFIGRTKEQSRLVGLHQPTSAPEPEAISCQGAMCAFWVGLNDSDGKSVGGNCAITLIPAGISNVAGIGSALAGALVGGAQPMQIGPAGPRRRG